MSGEEDGADEIGFCPFRRQVTVREMVFHYFSATLCSCRNGVFGHTNGLICTTRDHSNNL